MRHGDDILDRAQLTHVWRLRCRQCGVEWKQPSAEAGPCPECDAWALIVARVPLLDTDDFDGWPL
jgi:rubrerythrin